MRDLQKLRQLLNARQQDLETELGVYLNLTQMVEVYPNSKKVIEDMKARLLDKFELSLEAIAEDEEIELKELDDLTVNRAIYASKDKIEAQLKVNNTISNYIQQIKQTGATEDELSGLISFAKRLEEKVMNRYEVTENDITTNDKGEL